MAWRYGMTPKRVNQRCHVSLLYLVCITIGSAAGARNQGGLLPTPAEAEAEAAPAAAPDTTTASRVVYATLPASFSPEVPEKRIRDLQSVPGQQVTPATVVSPEVRPASGTTVTTVTTTTTTTTTVTSVPSPPQQAAAAAGPAAAAAAGGGMGCGNAMYPCSTRQQQQQQQSMSGTPEVHNDGNNSEMTNDNSSAGSGDDQGDNDKHHKHHKNKKKDHDEQQQAEDKDKNGDTEYLNGYYDDSDVVTEVEDNDGDEDDESIPRGAVMTKPSPAPAPQNLQQNNKSSPTIPDYNGTIDNDTVNANVTNNESNSDNLTSSDIMNDRGGRDGEEYDSAIPPWLQRKDSPSPKPAAAAAATPSPGPKPTVAAAAAVSPPSAKPTAIVTAAAAVAAAAKPSPSPKPAAATAAAAKPSPSPKPTVAAGAKEQSSGGEELEEEYDDTATTEQATKPSPAAAAAAAANSSTAEITNSTTSSTAQPTKAVIVDGRAFVTASVQPSPSLLPSPAAAAAAAAAAAVSPNVTATGSTGLKPAFGSLSMPGSSATNGSAAEANMTVKTAALTGSKADTISSKLSPKPFILQQAGAKQTILIGCVLPFEGTQEVVGKAVYQSLKMALTEKAKTILPGVNVNLTCSNSKCIDIPAFVAANEFAREGAVAIIGDVCSGATVAAAGVSNAKQLPIISAASSSPALSSPDFFFRTIPSDRYQGIAAAELVVKNGGKNVGVLYEDNPYGYGLAFSFIAAFTPYGGNVPVIYSFKRGQGDPNKALSEVLAGKKNGTFPVDAVFIAANNITFTAAFLKVAYAAKLGLKVYSGDSSANPALFKSLKDTPAAVSDFVMTAPNPGDPAFMAAFEKFTGGNKTAYSAYASRGFDAMIALLQAYKAATPPKKGQNIITQLQRQAFKGVSGPIAFDSNGDLNVTGNTYVSATFDPSTGGIRFGQPINISNGRQKKNGRR